MTAVDGADVSCREEKLLQAARVGDATKVAELLEEYTAIDVNCVGKNKWNLHWTPLHLACYFGHVDAARILLEKGANPSQPNAEGDTPLHKAALTGREPLVMLLLSKGADVFTKNVDGQKAYDVASELYIRNALIAAEIADKKRKEKTFLTAVKAGDMPTLRQMISDTVHAGLIDVNGVDISGNSALHLAAHRDQKMVAILLMQCGADPYLKNKRGLEPADYAQSEEMKSILKVAAIREIRGNVARFEGAVHRKKKILGTQTVWAVLERGVLSFFRTRADSTVGARRKRFHYLDEAIVVPNPRDERALTIVLADNCTERLSVANTLDRNRWLKALEEHIEYSHHEERSQGTPKSLRDHPVNPEYLGNVQDALKTAQAKQQKLANDTEEAARLHTAYLESAFESGDGSVRVQNSSQLLREQLQTVYEEAESTLQSLETCLLLMKQQEERMNMQLAQEREKNRALRETLQAFSIGSTEELGEEADEEICRNKQEGCDEVKSDSDSSMDDAVEAI